MSPFRHFVASEAFAGVLLFAAALVAFAWANSPLAGAYAGLHEVPFGVRLGGWSLEMKLEGWVNDGLMAVFFLLVGLEIKRELLVGELARPQRARLAVAAAFGGMLVPAAIFAALNLGGPGGRGWGVPMATDIAFALGVLSLLGRRVPLAVKVFLTALAIVDDLGAVLVIALFYGRGLDLGALGMAVAVLGLALTANAAGIRALGVYGALGAVLWYLVLVSGVHPTVAGVLLAFTVPVARTIIPPRGEIRAALEGGRSEAVGARLEALERELEERQSPLHRLEHGLQPWVTYLVLPVFALFNAGLALGGASPLNPVTAGAFLGLVLGKPVGVLLASWLAVRAGLASLPTGASWAQMAGVACLAGVGFTMSLFIAALAFPDVGRLDAAKLGVLSASLVSGALGLSVLWRVSPPAGAADDELPEPRAADDGRVAT